MRSSLSPRARQAPPAPTCTTAAWGPSGTGPAVRETGPRHSCLPPPAMDLRDRSHGRSATPEPDPVRSQRGTDGTPTRGLPARSFRLAHTRRSRIDAVSTVAPQKEFPGAEAPTDPFRQVVEQESPAVDRLHSDGKDTGCIHPALPGSFPLAGLNDIADLGSTYGSRDAAGPTTQPALGYPFFWVRTFLRSYVADRPILGVSICLVLYGLSPRAEANRLCPAACATLRGLPVACSSATEGGRFQSRHLFHAIVAPSPHRASRPHITSASSAVWRMSRLRCRTLDLQTERLCRSDRTWEPATPSG